MPVKIGGYTHSHVTEREVAHQSPCGFDDNKWEDCTFVAGLEWWRATGHPNVPATHLEAEHLRCAAGEAPTGGTSIPDLKRGILARYDSATPAARFAKGLRLRPGEVAVVQGLMGALSSHWRRWDAGFTGKHATVVFYDSLTTVWWCDPLAPEGTYQGERMTYTDLDKYTGGFTGAAALVGLIVGDTMQPLPITDSRAVKLDVKVGAQLYLPDLTPKVKVTTVNNATSPFGTRLNNTDYRAAYISTGGVTQLLLARTADCLDIQPIPTDIIHTVTVNVDGVKKAEVLV
jgi:hypothetical protein